MIERSSHLRFSHSNPSRLCVTLGVSSEAAEQDTAANDGQQTDNRTSAMLTGLKIGNFKAFAERQHLAIRPITLIFGPNSSGKSSVIHSLLLANHAMKTGQWDVHEPLAAGRMVDLGGFPTYVHGRHDDGVVSIECELIPPPKGLSDWLLGKNEERAPFCALRSFGLALEIARRRGAEESAETDPALVVQAAEILMDGRPALRFERVRGQMFRCRVIGNDHPFLASLLNAMHALSATVERDGAAGAGSTPPASNETMSSPADLERAFPVLQAKFSQVMAERRFALVRGLEDIPDLYHLVDATEPEDLPAQSELTEDQVNGNFGGSVIKCCLGWYRYSEFLREFLRSEDPWVAPSDRPSPEAEAQAVRINLCLMLQFLTLYASCGLLGLSYLGPLRQPPARAPGSTRSDPDTAVGSGLAEWKQICLNAAAREQVNRWLGSGWLGTDYRLEVRNWRSDDTPPQHEPEPVFTDTATGARHHARDLGFGVCQVLPVLVQAAVASNRLVCVEQPELHLHPAQQAELGDVFIEAALGNRRNTFLLETHSEHLILRILRRVRETTDGKLPKDRTPIRPEDISVVYVQPGRRGAEVIELPVTPDGDFSRPWPNGFFAERFQELP